MKSVELPDVINITIPAQEYDELKYLSTGNCYIKEQLKRLFPKETIYVSGFGLTMISNQTYEPTEHFSCKTLKEAFSKRESVDIKLIKFKA